MAESLISGHDGSVTLPSMHGGKAISWELGYSMANKDISGYGDGRFTKHRGGILTFDGTINILLKQGATATPMNLTAASIDGATLTLTSMTGCAHSGTALFTNGRIQHAHNDPAVGGSYTFRFTSTVTEVWAVA